jgi:hypothetical protein
MRLPVTGKLDSAFFDIALKTCQPCVLGKDLAVDLDLSSAELAYPSGLVPLAGLLKFLAARKVRIQVVEYPSPKFCPYYCHVGFFKQIGAETPCRKNRRPSGAELRSIKITELMNPEIRQVTSRGLARLLQKLPKGHAASSESRKSFIDACGELVANTRHAYNTTIDAGVTSNPHAILQAQHYPKKGIVEFCICDCGLGIKRTMESGVGRQLHTSHLDAVIAALGFRNKAEIGGGVGLGLSALETYVKKNGGTLRIRSGDALRVRMGQTATSTQDLDVWPGTIVTLEIQVEKTTDLSKITARLGKSS